jgi:hypothetical protein
LTAGLGHSDWDRRVFYSLAFVLGGQTTLLELVAATDLEVFMVEPRYSVSPTQNDDRFALQLRVLVSPSWVSDLDAAVGIALESQLPPSSGIPAQPAYGESRYKSLRQPFLAHLASLTGVSYLVKSAITADSAEVLRLLTEAEREVRDGN